MANNCYFEMKIAGEEKAVDEFVQMIKWQGGYGLGRVFSFEETERDPAPLGDPFIAVTGSGDCAWSLLTSLVEWTDDRNLLTEAKRLGLVIEAFSSEPGCCFQEHFLINKGEPLIADCVDYHEYLVDGLNDAELQSLAEELSLTPEFLRSKMDVNGDYCVGGLGDQFGDYGDLFSFLQQEKKRPLDQQISSAETKTENCGTSKSDPDLER